MGIESAFSSQLVLLRLARADGTYQRLLTRLAKVDVLVLDDFAISPLTEESRRDLQGARRWKSPSYHTPKALRLGGGIEDVMVAVVH